MEASTEINFLSFPKVLLLKLIIFITPSMCAHQTFLQEPTLDYSTFISEKNSLPGGIVSVRRSLLVAKRCLDRANKRLITIINHSKSRTNKWKFIVVAADLRKAIRHAPMLVFVAPNKKEKGGQQSKDVVAKYALDMSALLKRLLLDVERDLQIAKRSISL